MGKTKARGKGCKERDRGRKKRSGKKERDRERKESQNEMQELWVEARATAEKRQSRQGPWGRQVPENIALYIYIYISHSTQRLTRGKKGWAGEGREDETLRWGSSQ